MRILMVSQHYWPESFINTDICSTLVQRGHQVTVLTGLPNYPEGVIAPEYRAGRNRRQRREGVDIIRVPIVARGSGLQGIAKIRRVANYGSFLVFGWLKARHLGPGFDVVLTCQTSPVTMSGPALAYSRRYGAKVLLWCCDLAPADLLVGGVTEGSVVYRLYSRVARRIYGAAHRIAVSSPKFSEYLYRVAGIDGDKVFYLPHFAEDMFAAQDGGFLLDTQTAAQFDSGKVNLVFAGNVGNYQAVETIVRAAAILKEEPDVRFHIIGSGSRLEECKRMAAEQGVDNLVFHGRRPLELMPSYYRCADAMLMTLSASDTDPVVAYTLPRRLQTILAAGKPVIAALSGEAARVIEDARCGYCCPPEDATQLASLCLRFARLPADERAAMAENARTYYAQHFSKEKFFDDLEGHLEALRASRA